MTAARDNFTLLLKAIDLRPCHDGYVSVLSFPNTISQGTHSVIYKRDLVPRRSFEIRYQCGESRLQGSRAHALYLSGGSDPDPSGTEPSDPHHHGKETRSEPSIHLPPPNFSTRALRPRPCTLRIVAGRQYGLLPVRRRTSARTDGRHGGNDYTTFPCIARGPPSTKFNRGHARLWPFATKSSGRLHVGSLGVDRII